MNKFLAGASALVLATSLTWVPAPARAQAGGGATVISGATCPSSTVLNVGNNRPLIETQQGALCTNASGGGGGGGAVTAVPGAFADGAITTQGALADAACGTDTGTCTEIALFKRSLQRATTLITAVGSPLQAGGTVAATQSGTWLDGVKGLDGSTIASSTNQFPEYAPTALTSPAYSFNRPGNTTGYAAAGELVANNTTAGSVVPISWSGLVRAAGECYRIERMVMTTTNTSLTNASFKALIFEASPTVSVGDGAAFDASGVLQTSGVLNLKGQFSITLSASGSDGAQGAGTPLVGNAVTVCPTSGTTIYALLEYTGGGTYTPTSAQPITLKPEGYRP